jgi:hypothetical protein
MVASCDNNSIDVRVFDKPTQIVGGLGIGESRFGFSDPTRVRIAQADDLHSGNFGEAPHEFIGSSTATEETDTDFFIGRCKTLGPGSYSKTCCTHSTQRKKTAS